MIQNLLSSTGKAVYGDSEAIIDSATALSGSGPAYIFHFMQSMIDSAKAMGFNQAQAERGLWSLAIANVRSDHQATAIKEK